MPKKSIVQVFNEISKVNASLGDAETELQRKVVELRTGRIVSDLEKEKIFLPVTTPLKKILNGFFTEKKNDDGISEYIPRFVQPSDITDATKDIISSNSSNTKNIIDSNNENSTNTNNNITNNMVSVVRNLSNMQWDNLKEINKSSNERTDRLENIMNIINQNITATNTELVRQRFGAENERFRNMNVQTENREHQQTHTRLLNEQIQAAQDIEEVLRELNDQATLQRFRDENNRFLAQNRNREVNESLQNINNTMANNATNQQGRDENVSVMLQNINNSINDSTTLQRFRDENNQFRQQERNRQNEIARVAEQEMRDHFENQEAILIGLRTDLERMITLTMINAYTQRIQGERIDDYIEAQQEVFFDAIDDTEDNNEDDVTPLELQQTNQVVQTTTVMHSQLQNQLQMMVLLAQLLDTPRQTNTPILLEDRQTVEDRLAREAQEAVRANNALIEIAPFTVTPNHLQQGNAYQINTPTVTPFTTNPNQLQQGNAYKIYAEDDVVLSDTDDIVKVEDETDDAPLASSSGSSEIPEDIPSKPKDKGKDKKKPGKEVFYTTPKGEKILLGFIPKDAEFYTTPDGTEIPIEIYEIGIKMRRLLLINPYNNNRPFLDADKTKNKLLLENGLLRDLHNKLIKAVINYGKIPNQPKSRPRPQLSDSDNMALLNYLQVNGLGIRKGQPLNINKDGTFGNVKVDMSKLKSTSPHLVVKNRKGTMIINRKVDIDTIKLLTQPFYQNKKYSDVAKTAFRDVMKVANVEGTGHPKGKICEEKPAKTIKIIKSADDAMSRLELIMGSIKAGNTSQEMKNEASELLDYLLKERHLNLTDHKTLFKTIVG